MSKHWRPDENAVRARFGAGKRPRSLDEFVPLELAGQIRRVRRLPDGAKVGLILFAAACIGAAIGLYEVAGPRDVFERDPGGDWNAVEEAARH